MLSIPNHDGWSRFQLRGTREYSLNCTEDLPFEWIRQTIHGLSSKNPFCVTAETEPGKLICVVGWNCHVLREEDRESVRAGKIKHEYSDVNMLMFGRMLYDDISFDLDDWVRSGKGSDVGDPAERKAELNNLLAELKLLLDGKNG